MEKILSVSGFGDIFSVHFEAGIVLAEEYFDQNNLDFLKCHEAFEKDENSTLVRHWAAAQTKANLALYAFNLQDSSMLELEISEEAD